MFFRDEKEKQELWEQVSEVVHDASYDDHIDRWAKELHLPNDVNVSTNVLDDSDMMSWMQKETVLQGGGIFAWNIFSKPTASKTSLLERQRALRLVPADVAKGALTNLHTNEKDVLWALSMPSLSDAPMLQILYPQTPFIRLINRSSLLLTFFHLYRGYIAPGMHFVGPVTTLLGPYMYLRKQLGMKMPILTYLHMMLKLAKTLARPSYNLRQDTVKLGTFILYVVLFVLGVLQSLELAKTVRFLRRHVDSRLESIRAFVSHAQDVQSKIHPKVWKAFGIVDAIKNIRIPEGVKGMHALLTQDALRTQVKTLMKRMYLLDALSIMKRKGMCLVKILEPKQNAPHPIFWSMGHVQLPETQVRNPVCLKRNLIVTGPNAGGKTTYVRSMCANILLAQSFGVAFASRGVLAPYHALGSFMRVVDTLGKASLFEAEAKRCSEIIHQVEEASSIGLRSIVFLDEPMHSTPPIEGASTSIATIEHIGKLPGARVVATTHYFAITELPIQDTTHFQNVSMEAIPLDGKGFRFPYRIRNGASYQCIALELLENSGLPDAVISRAMEWKNKICAREVRNDDR